MSPRKLSRRSLVQTGAVAAGALAAHSLMPAVTSVPLASAAEADDRGTLIMRGSGSGLPESFNPLTTDARVWL